MGNPMLPIAKPERLEDRRLIESLVELMRKDGLSRTQIQKVIIRDVPTDLDILNEVLDAFAYADEVDGSILIH
jgi:hypothetical protein